MEFSSKTDKLSTPIKLEWLGQQRKVFSSFKQIRDWLQSELLAGDKLKNYAVNSYKLCQAADPLGRTFKYLNGISTHLNNLHAFDQQADRDDAAIQETATRIRSSINYYANNHLETKLLIFNSQEINNLYKYSPNAAGIRLMDFLDITPDTQLIQRDIHSYLKAAIEAFKQPRQLKQEAALLKETAKAAAKEWDETLNKVHTEHNDALTALMTKVHSWTRRREEHENEWKAQQEAHKAEMAEIESNYTARMELGAGEETWEYRMSSHSVAAIRWFIGLMIMLTVVLVAISCAIGYVVSHPDYLLGASSNSQTGISPLILALVAGLSLVIFWILKAVAGEYRRNRALADDAQERATMLRTFRALEYSKQTYPPERAVIIQALFRPHGLNPEDTMPHPVWEAFIKEIGSKTNKP